MISSAELSLGLSDARPASEITDMHAGVVYVCSKCQYRIRENSDGDSIARNRRGNAAAYIVLRDQFPTGSSRHGKRCSSGLLRIVLYSRSYRSG